MDLIDPLRGSEIKIARDNYKIAQNNFEIKRKDLIQEEEDIMITKNHSKILKIKK